VSEAAILVTDIIIPNRGELSLSNVFTLGYDNGFLHIIPIVNVQDDIRRSTAQHVDRPLPIAQLAGLRSEEGY